MKHGVPPRLREPVSTCHSSYYCSMLLSSRAKKGLVVIVLLNPAGCLSVTLSTTVSCTYIYMMRRDGERRQKMREKCVNEKRRARWGGLFLSSGRRNQGTTTKEYHRCLCGGEWHRFVVRSMSRRQQQQDRQQGCWCFRVGRHRSPAHAHGSRLPCRP